MGNGPDDTVDLLSTSDDSINLKWGDLVSAAQKLYKWKETTLSGPSFKCDVQSLLGTTLLFSSQESQDNFGVPNGVLKEEHKAVVMGLDPSTAAGDHSLDDIRAAFNARDAIPGTAGEVINALGSTQVCQIATEAGNINAYWLLPKEATLEVAIKLYFKIVGTRINALEKAKEALKSEFGLTLPNTDIKDGDNDLRVILTQITTFQTDSSSNSKYILTLRLPGIEGFILYVSHATIDGKEETSIGLKEDDKTLTPEQRVDKLNSMAPRAPASSAAVPSGIDGFNILHLWYADFNLSSGGETNWSVAFIISLTIHGTQLNIYLSYDTETFKGGILLQSTLPPLSAQKLLPRYREYHSLPAGIPVPPQISLNQLLSITLPSGVPSQLTEGSVTYDKTKSHLHVEVELVGNQPSADSDVPAPFSWDDAKLIVDKTESNTTWEVKSTFTLHSEEFSPDGHLTLHLTYDTSGQLSLTGEAGTVKFGQLIGFFDKKLDSAIGSVLGNIQIESLIVDYEYDTSNPPATASAFSFTGVISFAKLKLQMFYQYASQGKSKSAQDLVKKQLARLNLGSDFKVDSLDVSNGPSWRFDAYVSTADSDATLGDIIGSIIGEDGNSIPPFIAKIKVGNSTDRKFITFNATKRTLSGDNTQPTDVVLVMFDLKLGPLNFSFLQLGGQTVTKRVLRFSVGQLPFFNTIPIVKELPQPYQLLTFCWVGGGQEITIDEISFLNDQYLNDPDVKIYYKKEVQKQTTGLRPNSHFIVVNNDECVLDHVFDTGSSPPPNALRQRRAQLAVASAATASSSGSEAPPTKGALKKQTDFFSISAISLQYKDEALWLFLDCSIKLGPIELDLIGFGIGIDLSKKNGINLQDLEHPPIIDTLMLQLHGLAMDFDQPPLQIAGVFVHEKANGIESYRGGIAVKFEPYSFLAIGEYEEINQNEDKYKSIFIFAKLDGPLIDLEIAIIKGVRLGFGYNSFVRSPTVKELADFPFVSDSALSKGNNPAEILELFRGGTNPWIQVKHDSLWFALGFSVAAFDIVKATAVGLFQFSDQGIVINIFADVVGQMPPDAEKPEECILYVELLLNAELNFIYDYFFVQAALAPTSFLIVPQCHLYGGFACGNWFGRSDHGTLQLPVPSGHTRLTSF
ncbi:hypothetical protein GP486_000255 [Trichoglossum hirsutum]|uniref:DUF6603 domain-containing protein n=1 Tax=Trichoglossum hirsutum TaxID=265104 RepID=A0A9P8LJD2_9PEZI|nr:hypothetical protein GP486_000255 [Trichoglossum hirsutum]